MARFIRMATLSAIAAVAVVSGATVAPVPAQAQGIYIGVGHGWHHYRHHYGYRHYYGYRHHYAYYPRYHHYYRRHYYYR
jgi:hypothetical protein